MIQTVRLDADSFIGTSYEEIVWKEIERAKEKCANEFKLCFSVTEGGSDMVKQVATAVQLHLDALQLKTTIKLWENCAREFVFLDVYSNDNHTASRNYRFAIKGIVPFNIIEGFTFLVDHHEFIRSQNNTHFSRDKKQKRNDSKDHDYNK